VLTSKIIVAVYWVFFVCMLCLLSCKRTALLDPISVIWIESSLPKEQPGFNPATMWRDIGISTDNQSIYVVGGVHYLLGCIWQSQDGGTTWRLDSISPKGYTDIDLASDGAFWLCGYDGVVRRGSHLNWPYTNIYLWTPLNEIEVLPNAQDYLLTGGSSYRNGLLGRINGIGGGFITRDSLATETSCILALDNQIALIGGYGVVYRSTDWGLTWQLQWVPDDFIVDAELHPDGTIFLLGLSGGIYTSSDTGLSWQEIVHPSNGNRIWHDMAFSSDGSQAVMVGVNDIRISNDGGRNWGVVADKSTYSTDNFLTVAWQGDTVHIAGAAGVYKRFKID
jgi:photosystem II stability/assembly factor-like uncharacterized protein